MSVFSGERLSRSARLALGLTVPIAVLAMTASLAGLLAPGTYAAETANWAGQAIGQDAVNLVIYPLTLVLAWRAARGSLVAYLWWLGAAAYSTYSYLLYAGFVHFSGWFLVYVGVFGLSTFALIAGLTAVDPARLRDHFTAEAPVTLVGRGLAVFGVMFALLWLTEIVPAALAGEIPQTVLEAGLVTNPVWMLDLGVVLPAMIAAGVLLARRRPLGFLLAGPLLAFAVLMGAAILGMFVALAVRGEPAAVVPMVLMGVVVAVEAALLRVLGAATHRHLALSDCLRGNADGDVAQGGEVSDRRAAPVAGRR